MKRPCPFVDDEVSVSDSDGMSDLFLDEVFDDSFLDDSPSPSGRSLTGSPPPNPYLSLTPIQALSRSPSVLSPLPSELGSPTLSLRRSISPVDALAVAPVPSAKPFRCSVTKILVTYPKCGEIVRLERNLREQFGDNLKAYIISRERHKDGTYHLHFAAEFVKKLSIRGGRINRLAGANANIRPCGSRKYDWINCVKYVAGHVAKKVGEYSEVISHPPDLLQSLLDYEKYLHNTAAPAKTGAGEAAFRGARNGDSAFQIIEANPSLALQSRNVQYLVDLVRNQGMLDSLSPKFKFVGVLCAHPWAFAFETWYNFWFAPGAIRAIRTPQLYICGPPGCGKTSFIAELAKCFRQYHMTPERQYVDGFDDVSYDMVVMDEFDGQRPLTFLNSFLDGSPMRIQRKCMVSGMKTVNLPCVILSNYSPEELYPKAEHLKSLAAFRDRLLFVTIPDNMKLYDALKINVEPK